MVESSSVARLTFLDAPPRYVFFTGKGGVGKTSLASASALFLTDAGKRVLLVSTDPASNLDEMLGISLANFPTPVPGADGLEVLNIDPESAAESYRLRVMEQLPPQTTEAERGIVREQLSGACTTEIAAFDEFTALLGGGADRFDHVLFDTAPSGHTLRLLSLPAAWTGFLAGNDRGASCLGPHSGLKTQAGRFAAALATLSDPAQATVVLVARPESSAIREVARMADELKRLGLTNQHLVINGVFHASDPADEVAVSIDRLGREAVEAIPPVLRMLPRDEVPLRPFDTIGLPALRALLAGTAVPAPAPAEVVSTEMPAWAGLDALADELAAADSALILVMGKGGVGKTTIASALALGLIQRGKTTHLSTTDPAAHLAMTLQGDVPGLHVDRIDPKEETRRYVEKTLAARGPGLDEQGRQLLLEDLRSPCTEEVAVFHAFSRIVREARSAFVVLDTAPTGHSLLLMDATGAYHRQTMRQCDHAGNVVTPLMRLQDPIYTRIILVALPEATPVSQAAALQEDLRRAQIEPFAWVLNRSLAAARTREPLLAARLAGERRQMRRIANGLATRTFTVPWLTRPPVGVHELSQLVAPAEEN